jgi:membrane associated rhomboid family serine protease
MIIPLRSTERVYSNAIVTGSLIAVNIAAFLYQVTLPSSALNQFVAEYGIVPDHLRMASLVTSMFLHAGWLHLLGNMLYLWVFGRNVEDLIGSARFLLFYILCGVAAGAVHVIFNAYSRTPTIGASGAIAGVMGAYLIKFPKARIITLAFFLFVWTLEIPATFLLLWWFAMQFFNGVGSLAMSESEMSGTAWFAHVGGFLAGMFLIRWFPSRQRWRAWYDNE